MSLFESIRKNYDFMDKMPLKGWIWEFIRRSESYIQEYKTIEKAITKSSGENDKVINHFLKKIQQMRLNVPFHRVEESNKDYFLEIKEGMYIPKPNATYSYIHESLDIKGITPVKVIPYKEYSEDESRFRNVIHLLDGDIDFEEEHPAVSLVQDLAMPTLENTIYVGISKKAKIEDIEKQLLPILSEYLETGKQRARDDKWKYYLICFDLRVFFNRDKKMSYEKIAEILANTYPKQKKLFNARNVISYFMNALRLIQGDYKDNLY